MLEQVKWALSMAQAPTSGKKVGVCLIASKGADFKTFMGCNIELSTSTVFHAERVALIKAISEGYICPLEIHLIANNEDSCMPLCGYCRQDYMYLNPDLGIVVYHVNGTIKYNVKLVDLMSIPYMGKSKIE